MNKLPLEELIESIMIHELTMRQDNEDEGRKKRIIILKSTTIDEEEDESTDENDEDEDIALIMRKFKKFIWRRKQGFKKKPLTKGKSSKDKKKERKQPMCFEYKNLDPSRLIVPT